MDTIVTYGATCRPDPAQRTREGDRWVALRMNSNPAVTQQEPPQAPACPPARKPVFYTLVAQKHAAARCKAGW